MQQQQQYYPATVPRHGEHVYHHPGAGYIHPAAAARMQWSPANVQHAGQWTYDLAGAYPGFVPSMPGLHSPDPQSAATPHNIRDILAQSGGQAADTLQSEIAKTPSAYQKSPSSAGAATGTVFHYPTPVSGGQEHLRSPTTPNHPAEIPQFYIPALQGKSFVGFDPSALSSDPIHGLPPGLAYYGGPGMDPKGGASPMDKTGSASKDGKKEKKGRATFSGNQIDELEKIFNSNQYLTNQERHNLAERLSLSENQVKIWFQNRRTKCRRTSWKRPSSMTSPTTPTAPVSFPPNTPTTPTEPNPPPPTTQ